MRLGRLHFLMAASMLLFANYVVNPEIADAKTYKAVAGSGEEFLLDTTSISIGSVSHMCPKFWLPSNPHMEL